MEEFNKYVKDISYQNELINFKMEIKNSAKRDTSLIGVVMLGWGVVGVWFG